MSPKLCASVTKFAVVLAALFHVQPAQAQVCPINTNGGCSVIAQPAPNSNIFYSPSNSNPFQLYARSSGTCDVGSCAGVNFFSGIFPVLTLVAGCGNLQLNGQWQLLTCTGTNRGTSPAGPYEFQIYLHSQYYAFNAFSVTHSQVTSTAATPTVTVEVPTTLTFTETSTSTSTSTETSPQVTVTEPAATDFLTSTVTPVSATVSTTKTRTYTRFKIAVTKVCTTTTKTAKCTTKPTPKPCPTHKGRPKPVKRPHPRSLPGGPGGAAAPLVKRQGDGGVNGDGPLTIIVTPAPSYTTVTTVAGSTTETSIVSTSTTVTVPPDPLTTTVYTGVSTTISTTTLPQGTITKTFHTKTYTTRTKTITATWRKVATVTPTCSKR